MKKSYFSFLKKRKKIKLMYFIVLTLLLLIVATGYYFFYRQRNRELINVTAILVRPQNIALNVPFNWTPYWISKSISIGDKDINPLGGINAIVVDKESVDSVSYGQTVSLLLRVQAVKDRSGIYLYKNKPLSVGTLLDLKLTNTQTSAYVTYIGKELPNLKSVVLRVNLKGRLIEPEAVEAIKMGDTIKNSKNNPIAKIVSKNDSTADLRIDSPLNISAMSTERSKRDVNIVLDLVVKNIDSSYFFIDNQRIRPSETFFISFPNVTLANYQITKVELLKDTQL